MCVLCQQWGHEEEEEPSEMMSLHESNRRWKYDVVLARFSLCVQIYLRNADNEVEVFS